MYQILLVEDTETDAELLNRALRLAGVANPIHRARNGADALAFLSAKEKEGSAGEPLGIVLVDLKLPDKSGLDILKVMQGRKAFDDVLRVVISQIEQMEQIKRAYALGADTFMAKPITQPDLAEVLRSYPDNWCLADGPESTGLAPADRYDKVVHIWAENRELIETLRRNLEALRNKLSDNEETFAIMETLKEEVRNNYERGATPAPRAKKKGRPNLLD
jgi:CheY-like chemotaxis protein